MEQDSGCQSNRECRKSRQNLATVSDRRSSDLQDDDVLQLSRGIAFILLFTYGKLYFPLCSSIPRLISLIHSFLPPLSTLDSRVPLRSGLAIDFGRASLGHSSHAPPVRRTSTSYSRTSLSNSFLGILYELFSNFFSIDSLEGFFNSSPSRSGRRSWRITKFD